MADGLENNGGLLRGLEAEVIMAHFTASGVNMLGRLRRWFSPRFATPVKFMTTFDETALRDLHGQFVAKLAQKDDVLFQGRVNNSEFILDIVHKRPGKRTVPKDLSWTKTLPAALEATKLQPHHPSFAAAMLGLAAHELLNAGRTSEAVQLAEKAVDRNMYDLWAQRILLKCKAHLGGESARADEAEEWLKTRFCEMPFEHFETLPTSEVISCCGSWLPLAIGNLEEANASIESVTNSPLLERVKTSIVDGSFRYCSRMNCPRIAHRTLPARKDVDVAAYQARQFPKKVVFSHDQTCNLSCPSCRKNLIIIRKSEQVRFDSLSPFLLPLMINADQVKVCGSGDPFASNHFRNLLRSYCRDPRAHRNIILHTNGVLCDRRAWEDLGLGEFVKAAWVSLDAAKEETYNYTRRDGDWGRALENIGFLSELRADGTVGSLALLFVVQGRNYREMTAFVELGKKYKADKVLFQAIINWGTYSEQEFTEHNIFSTQHPKHAEFIDMLDNEIFDDPIVDLSGVGAYRRAKQLAAE